MDHLSALSEQIAANFRKIEAAPKFAASRLWLTFYISGQPATLERIGYVLAGNGWANATGWEGGFLYPKKEVANDCVEIVQTAVQMQKLCEEHGAEILVIDVDTSSDVRQSQFITIYQAQG